MIDFDFGVYLLHSLVELKNTFSGHAQTTTNLRNLDTTIANLYL